MPAAMLAVSRAVPVVAPRRASSASRGVSRTSSRAGGIARQASYTVAAATPFAGRKLTAGLAAPTRRLGNNGRGSRSVAKAFWGGDEDRIEVVKLQIGLLGMARSLQEDLERIAEQADTSEMEGLHYILEETVLALLRNPEYSVYGYATSQSVRGLDEAEEAFNEFSMDERGKIGVETLVNVDDRIKEAKEAGDDIGEGGVRNEYILITIIAAADGKIEMPAVTDGQELRTALKRLGAIRVDGLHAVEVLWTPQEEGDTLSMEELLQDYPYLNNL